MTIILLNKTCKYHKCMFATDLSRFLALIQNLELSDLLSYLSCYVVPS